MHITLEVFGILFILIVYCIIGIVFSEWEKSDKPWITIFNEMLNRKLKSLCKKYPKNYQYDAVKDIYWYDIADVSKHGHNVMESSEIKEFIDDLGLLLYMLWPIFITIEYIKYLIYKIKN